MSTILERNKAIQTAIEFDANGKPLVVDGILGNTTLTAIEHLASMDPSREWPLVSAPVDAMGNPLTGSSLSAFRDALKFPWKACLAPITVGNAPGSPPSAFLDELVSVIKGLPDEVFSVNASKDDIYNKVVAAIGPWPSETGELPRRAAMCEILRVDAGFESGWRFNCGVDMEKGAGTGRPMVEWETSAWQVSADSLSADPSLKACFLRFFPKGTTQDFIDGMKINHAFAVEYAARLFRFDTRQSGPTNEGWVANAVFRDAVAEWQQALTS